MKTLDLLRTLTNSIFLSTVTKTGDSSSVVEEVDVTEEEVEPGDIWLINSSTWLNNMLMVSIVEKITKKRRKKDIIGEISVVETEKAGVKREQYLPKCQKTI